MPRPDVWGFDSNRVRLPISPGNSAMNSVGAECGPLSCSGDTGSGVGCIGLFDGIWGATFEWCVVGGLSASGSVCNCPPWAGVFTGLAPFQRFQSCCCFCSFCSKGPGAEGYGCKGFVSTSACG